MIVIGSYQEATAPIPEHEQCYTKLDADMRALNASLVEYAVPLAEQCGMTFRGFAGGAKLATPRGDQLERHHLYALAPDNAVTEASDRMIRAISDKHGPGDLWSVGPIVGMLADDGRIPCGDVDGVRHVLMRSIYFHDPVIPFGASIDYTTAIGLPGRIGRP